MIEITLPREYMLYGWPPMGYSETPQMHHYN